MHERRALLQWGAVRRTTGGAVRSLPSLRTDLARPVTRHSPGCRRWRDGIENRRRDPKPWSPRPCAVGAVVGWVCLRMVSQDVQLCAAGWPLVARLPWTPREATETAPTCRDSQRPGGGGHAGFLQGDEGGGADGGTLLPQEQLPVQGAARRSTHSPSVRSPALRQLHSESSCVAYPKAASAHPA